MNPEEVRTEEGVVVIVHTSDFRGDHAADANVAHVLPASTTLGEVIEMLGESTFITAYDWVEIPAPAARVAAHVDKKEGQE